MWIQVRSMDGKEFHKIKNLSKLTKVEELRLQLEDKFHATVDRIRLFYRGKQLEDGYTLFDYDVGLNDIVQVLVRPLMINDPPKPEVNGTDNSQPSSDQEENDQHAEKISSNGDAAKENEVSTSQDSDNVVSEENGRSQYYKVGDLIDTQDFDLGNGAWFEAKVTHIKKRTQVLETNSGFNNCVPESEDSKKGVDDSSSVVDDGLEYTARFERYEDDPLKLQLKDFRPRARRKIKFDDIREGDVVMVNYNFDEPKELGYWYDGEVTKIKNSRCVKRLIVRIHIGRDRIPMDGCEIHRVDEVFAIENHKLLSDQNLPKDPTPVVRVLKPNCSECRDDPNKKCKNCSCQVCGGKEDPQKQLLCDECDSPFHIYCLTPPLAEVPGGDEEWFCPSCVNDHTEVVKAGEKLKESKKKAKMASANSTSNRDWGRGMACVGRTKMCTIVPSDHFGPIPGIEVGTMWKFRVQVSESGVHRPHVAGIHGREGAGAFSIVLSGGYEDDLDEGEEFKYTGSGGRDLSGNKRTAEQSCDQTLTRMNKALALNCDASLNSKGAEAKNWKAGKPVRVVRNHKGSKHSKYCPEEGNRYDGIYKVVKYWPEKGKSGHLVWRYFLKRDDPAPAPWTKAGKERTKKLGLKMQYPDGYLENADDNSDPSTSKGKDKAKAKSPDDNSDFASPKGKGKKTKRKEKRAEHLDDEEEEEEASSPKKQKCVTYEIPPEVEKLIEKDQNKKLWDECKEHTSGGSQAFLEKVQETFACVCCQELVFKPVTTKCLHNACKTCLSRSFKAQVFTCPVCRFDLGKDYSMHINKTLGDILLKLFPGYDSGR